MDVTVLVENTKQNGANLAVENGLALLVEKDGKRILYDTGMRKDSMMQNARALGVDLTTVDAVGISHGHYDHTGGLAEFLKANRSAPVFIKKGAFEPHFARIGFFRKNIGADPAIAAQFAGRLRYVDKTVEIVPGAFIVPDIKKPFPIPTSNRPLMEGAGAFQAPDTFKHELFLAVKEKSGLAVFCGCGHSGVKNIVSTAREAFPGQAISLVIGGFHYQMGPLPIGKASRDEIEDTARWLLAEGVEKVYTGHCTGKYGIGVMKPILKDRLSTIHTGMRISA